MPSLRARLLFLLSTLTLISATLLPRQYDGYPYYGGNNPYWGGHPDGGSGGHGGHGGSGQTGANDASEFFNAKGGDADDLSSGSLSQSDQNKLATINFHKATLARIAHAALACSAVVFFFPVGSILVRILPGRLALLGHALCVLLGWIIFLAGVGLGIYIAVEVRWSTLDFFTMYHPIIGLVVCALVLLQPFGGLIHHWGYKRTGARTIASHLHIWIGRIIITLGIINGGLGLRFADNASRGQIIAYGVVGGIMWLLAMLIGCCFGHSRRGRRARPATGKDIMDGPVDESGYHHDGVTGATAVPMAAAAPRRGLLSRSRRQRPVSQVTDVSSVSSHNDIPTVPAHTRGLSPVDDEEPVSPIDDHHTVRTI